MNLQFEQGKFKSELQVQMRSTADATDHALQMAEACQRANTRLQERFEDVVRERARALEHRVGEHDKMAMSRISVADQIMYLRARSLEAAP
jgi:hypothetical protein